MRQTDMLTGISEQLDLERHLKILHSTPAAALNTYAKEVSLTERATLEVMLCVPRLPQSPLLDQVLHAKEALK